MFRPVPTLLGLLSSCLWLHAQPASEPSDSEPIDPKDDGVRVSVLGYHDFTIDEPETEMRIRADKFRRQMELIRQLGITVISLEQFHAWKSGEAAIPEKSILITVDDGWKSFHDIAYPILKEFDYPYTLFLYKNYVDGGGRALTTPMIRKMIKDGATIGSHSVSHPYPVVFKQQERKGEEAYLKFLRTEMGDSKTFLEKRFRTPITTYTYPGGYVTKEMLPLVSELGYEYAFTIKPGKVRRSDDNNALPRFMVLGNYDRVFEFAVDYSEGGTPLTDSALMEKPDHPVTPAAGLIIPDRLPTISADLSAIENLDPDSLEMRVSGFTKVPATFDPASKVLSWQVNRPLRVPTCEITVTWRDLEGEPQEKPLRWGFQIDREAAYLDQREEPSAPTPEEPTPSIPEEPTPSSPE